MSTWQDQSQRVKGYLRPWPIILTGIRCKSNKSLGCMLKKFVKTYAVLFKRRPAWLGGSVRPEGVTARDYVSGQVFQKFGVSASSKMFLGIAADEY